MTYSESGSRGNAENELFRGSEKSADIANLQTQLDATLASIASLQSDLTTTQTDLTSANATIATLQTDLAAETTARIASDSTEANARVDADSVHDNDISVILANSVLALDGLLSLSGGDTAQFDGVNVRITNGLGDTRTINGLGNLVVGYDEPNLFGSETCSFGEYLDQPDCASGGGVSRARLR